MKPRRFIHCDVFSPVALQGNGLTMDTARRTEIMSALDIPDDVVINTAELCEVLQRISRPERRHYFRLANKALHSASSTPPNKTV